MFEWLDQNGADLFYTLALPVLVGLFLLAGGVIHGLNREYRQYLKFRKFRAAQKAMYEGAGK